LWGVQKNQSSIAHLSGPKTIKFLAKQGKDVSYSNILKSYSGGKFLELIKICWKTVVAKISYFTTWLQRMMCKVHLTKPVGDQPSKMSN
jgi:hypothetical protein